MPHEIAQTKTWEDRKRLPWAVTVVTFIFLMSYYLIATASLIDAGFWFGDRNEAVFDLWSIQHLLVGVLLGFVLKAPTLTSSHGYVYSAVIIALALIWEVFEYAGEYGVFGESITAWLGGNNELLANRLWGDVFMVNTGAWLALVFRPYKRAVIIVCVGWIIINLIAKDSTSIQTALFG